MLPIVIDTDAAGNVVVFMKCDLEDLNISDEINQFETLPEALEFLLERAKDSAHNQSNRPESPHSI